jgi:hypothetical protein
MQISQGGQVVSVTAGMKRSPPTDFALGFLGTKENDLAAFDCMAYSTSRPE